MKKLILIFIVLCGTLSFKCETQKSKSSISEISKQDSASLYEKFSTQNRLIYHITPNEISKQITRAQAVPHHLNYLYSQNRLLLEDNSTLRSLFLSTKDVQHLLISMGKDPSKKGGFRIYPSKETVNSNVMNLIIVSVDDNGVNTDDYMANTLLPCPDNCPTAKPNDTYAEEDLNYNNVRYNVRTGTNYSSGQTISEHERWLIPTTTHRFRWVTRRNAVEIESQN